MVREDSIDRRTALALCSGVASAGLAGYVGRGASKNRETGVTLQQSGFSGVRHKAIGGAELRKTEAGLQVGLPQGETGGVRALFGDVEGYQTEWAPLDARELDDGAFLTASANGVVSREGDEGRRRWLGSTRAVSEDDRVAIEVNYEPLGSETQLLVVLRNGDRIGTVEDHEGQSKAFVNEPPIGCGKPDFPEPFPYCYIWRWLDPVQMQIPGVGTAEADEIRMLADDSPYRLDSLGQFDVRMGGVSELTVESETIEYGSS